MATTRRIALLGTIAATALACSLTTIPDLTSGTGDGKDGADGGGPGDGGAEAAIDATAGGFCNGLGRQPSLCDDFDGLDALGKRWSIVRPFDGTFGVAIDPSVSRSAPNSLLARVEQPAPDCTYATLENSVPGAFTGTRLAYSVMIASANQLPGKSTISAQSFGKGSSLCQAFLTVVSPTSMSIGEQIIHEDGGREEADYDLPALPIGSWVSVVVDYDVMAKKLKVTVDEKNVLDVATALACPYAPGDTSVRVGLFCEPKGGTSRRLHYDDVVFDAR
ncbi:MAG: hypothetical protein JWP87_4559 [Labilithrix sp.]|nr:hypothetical protein [Labilithrix sp.]